MGQTKRVLFLMAASAAVLCAQYDPQGGGQYDPSGRGQYDPPGRAARLSYLNGSASIQAAGVEDWVDAYVNRPLTTGDHLWIGDGARGELQVDATAYRLNSDTALQILNLDDYTSQMSLSEGTLTVRLRRMQDGQVYEIDTPNSAITMMEDGAYRIDVDPNNQATYLTVWRGTAQVTGGGQAFTVATGEQAVIYGDQQINYNVQAAPGADSWDNWSGMRDRLRDQSISSRYVSPYMSGYDDLDNNGNWSSSPDYGNVWYPRVDSGWAPYRNGHWAWVAPWGWTWVDDSPWGYAPFHYGRWAFISGRWGWCPGPISVRPVYAPALVAWVGGGGGGGLGFSIGGLGISVGWFALGPREPFFPSYHASQNYFNQVNVTNTVINKTVINNYYNNTYINNVNNSRNITNINYANQRVQGAVVAVPQDRFASGQDIGRIARVVAPADIQRANIVARPMIAPTRASVLGARASTVATAPRPPAAVLSRPVVARVAPPPAPVSFSRQQTALAQNPGRPLAPAAIQQIRAAAPVQRPMVRVAAPAQVRPAQPVPARPQQPGVGQQPQQPAARPQRPDFSQPQQQPARPQQPSFQQPQQQQQPPARPQRPDFSQPQQQPARPQQPSFQQPQQQQQPPARPQRPDFSQPQQQPARPQQPSFQQPQQQQPPARPQRPDFSQPQQQQQPPARPQRPEVSQPQRQEPAPQRPTFAQPENRPPAARPEARPAPPPQRPPANAEPQRPAQRPQQQDRDKPRDK